MTDRGRYPTHRCPECSLVRCFYAGVTCDECLQHYANKDHEKYRETDILTGRPITTDTVRSFAGSLVGRTLAPPQVNPSGSPAPWAPPAPTSPSPSAPDDIWKQWEITPCRQFIYHPNNPWLLIPIEWSPE